MTTLAAVQQVPLRISLLTNMVTPYRVPLFKALAAHPAVSRLRVLTCVEREVDRQWQVSNHASYEVQQLAGLTLNFRRGDALRILHLRLGVFWELLRHRPDRLIIGDASWTTWLAMVACWLLRIPYVVWNEITTSSRVRGGAMHWLRRALYGHAHCCIASGKLARDFLLQHRCPPERIVIAHNAVDNDYFLAQRRHWEPHREGLRAGLGVTADTFVLLYVGQLIPRKRVMETLEAAAIVARQRPLHLLIVGSGSQEVALRQHAAELSFFNVTFCGHVQSERLSQLYVACDGVALLSEDEPWGMVVNEALLFSRQVILAESVGAADIVSRNLVDDDLSNLVDTIREAMENGEMTAIHNVPIPTAHQMAEDFIHALHS